MDYRSQCSFAAKYHNHVHESANQHSDAQSSRNVPIDCEHQSITNLQRGGKVGQLLGKKKMRQGVWSSVERIKSWWEKKSKVFWVKKQKNGKYWGTILSKCFLRSTYVYAVVIRESLRSRRCVRWPIWLVSVHGRAHCLVDRER